MLRRIALALCGVIVATFALAQTPNENILRMHAGVHPTYFCNYTLGQFCGGEAYSTTSLRTVTDATGAITYAPNNLLTYSNTFSNAAWNKNGAPTITINYPSVADPTGGYAANRLQGTSSNYIFQNSNVPLGVNGLFSVWLKSTSGATQYVRIGYYDNTGGNIYSPTLTLGATWVQYQLPFTVKNTTGSTVSFRSDPGGDAFDILAYMPVSAAVTYETSPRPGDQVITTSAAYYGPAFDYNATTLSPIGVRVEEARTNYQINSGTWSSAIADAAGTGSVPTITANYGVAPDGTTTATRAQLDKGSGVGYSRFQQITTVTSGVYTDSVWLRTTDGSTVTVGVRAGAATGSTVTVTGIWTRFNNTMGSSGTVADIQVLLWNTLATSQTADLLVWGGQVELGSFPTSYIPTAASSVTRAADVVTLQGAASRLLGATNRPVIVEASGWPGSSPNRLLADGSGALVLVSSTTQVGTFNGSTILSAALGSGTTAGAFRAGVSLLPGKRYICGNGGSLASDNNSYTPTGSMSLGSSGSAYFFDGHISKLAIYNRALTGPQLQSRTVLGAPF